MIATIILCILIAAAVFFAAKSMIKRRKSGCCGCEGCSGCSEALEQRKIPRQNRHGI